MLRVVYQLAFLRYAPARPAQAGFVYFFMRETSRHVADSHLRIFLRLRKTIAPLHEHRERLHELGKICKDHGRCCIAAASRACCFLCLRKIEESREVGKGYGKRLISFLFS
ncbi:hypothetical protein V8J88_18290 [Massilia sp. W12]|uniref:hypothetical protein n=1 Tax=Massilia sp. W12 TaxID=3126507 RepID=UPI0030D4F205